MSTYQQIQNKALNHFGANDDEFREEIKQAINDVIAEINSEVPFAQHLETTLTSIYTTAGLSYLNISQNIDNFINHFADIFFTVNDKVQPPLVYLTRKEFENKRINDSTQNQPMYFSLWDNRIYFLPTPDKAYLITINYYKYDSELINDLDEATLSDHYTQWERIILTGAIAKGYQYLATDAQMINLKLAEYQNGIKRFRSWMRKRIPKSPDASRVRCWKEFYNTITPLVPRPFRRYN